MRKGSLVTVLFLLICLSCSTEEQAVEHQGDEELRTLGFKVGGEFSSFRNQQSAAESGDDDLFAIQFYDFQTKKPYAHLIGDDISKVKVDFIKDRFYSMKMTHIKNAKNIIYQDNALWDAPFRRSNNETAVLHKPYYSSNIELGGVSSPGVGMIGSSGTYVESDRYYGRISEFEVVEEQEDLIIELKRMVFGITLSVELEEDDTEKIYFSINKSFGPREYIFEISEGIGSLEIPYITLGFPDHTDLDGYETEMDKALSGEYQEQIHISIGTPDHFTLFFDDYITVTRNKMVTIEVSPGEGEGTTNGGFNITFEEGMIEKNLNL